MQTKREQQKKHLALLNNDIKRQHSDTQMTFDGMTILAEKERNLIDAIVTLLDYDDSVIEAEVANIGAQLLYAMKESHEKINRLHSLIHVLQTAIKTAESNNRDYDMMALGRFILELEQSKTPPPPEYPVKEFAKLTHRHEHTIRTKFHSGELKGRQDSKGIFIAASELSKFKPESTEQE